MKICINGGNMITNKVCMIGIRHDIDDSRIYHKESESLIKHGYYLTIIANKGKSIPKCNYKILSGNIILKLIKAIKEGLNEKSDIYHVHDMEGLLAGVFIKILRQKSKLVWDVHEYYNKILKDNPINIQGRIFLYVMCLLEPIFIKLFVDGIIVVNDDLVERYKKLVKNKDIPIVAIYNYPLIDIKDTKESSSNNNKRIKKDIIDLIYVGGISDLRVEFICKLAEHIEKEKLPIKITLLGPITTKKFNVLSYKVINYVGVVPHKKVRDYLKCADIALLFFSPISENNKKGTPRKLFEYVSAGLPVLCNEELIYAKKYVLENGWGKCVKYLDVEGAIKAIYEIMDNWEQYHKNCLNTIFKYSWENEEKKLIEFYNKICNRK